MLIIFWLLFSFIHYLNRAIPTPCRHDMQPDLISFISVFRFLLAGTLLRSSTLQEEGGRDTYKYRPVFMFHHALVSTALSVSSHEQLRVSPLNLAGRALLSPAFCEGELPR